MKGFYFGGDMYDNILKMIQAAGSDNLSRFGGTWEGGYRLQQVPSELARFLTMLYDCCVQSYLEIGVADAGLARIVCDVLDVRDVHLVEPAPRGEFGFNVSRLRCGGSVVVSKCKTSEVQRWSSYDLVFVDGDHSYAAVKLDAEIAVKNTVTGGIIAFHDSLTCSGVHQVVRELGTDPRVKYGGTIGSKLGISWFVRSL